MKIVANIKEWAQGICNDSPDPVTFISGMAIGADQLFATSIIWLKEIGINCRLLAAVPFKGQEGKWPQKSRDKFTEILAKCDEVVYVSDPGYAAWKMQKRNVWMVDQVGKDGIVLAVWDGSQSGGTFNCVTYAIEQGCRIIHFSPTLGEVIVK